jgi:ribosome biogenesis GTPase
MLINLKDYGFTQNEFTACQNLKADKDTVNSIPARIIEARREQFKVICGYGEVPAELKGSFYHNLEADSLFPASGDFVLINYNNLGPSLITAVLPRRSVFSRVDFLGHAAGYAKNVKEQVLAANFDYVFILSSLNFDLNLNRLARYLTASLQGGGFPVFVLTKADLCDNYKEKTAEIRKFAREVPVIPISSKTGTGIDELAPFLEPAKTVVFLGSSGVGKSSLLNCLAGRELMDVKDIRENDSKGRHTTSHRQLFRLPSNDDVSPNEPHAVFPGVLVIDTPGIREVGLWDSQEGISLAFANVEELFSQCRFSDCSHQTEPGCAVLAALKNGSLSPEQWKQYQAQRKETNFTINHSAYLRQKQEFHKAIARNNKARHKKEFDK